MAKFKVKKGKKFFRGPRWNFFGRNKREFNVKAFFHDDCAYRLHENYDQINKLVGWSYNLFPFYDREEKKIKPGHHKNSVRFGWRCVDGETIELVAYAYIEGTRRSRNIIEVDTDEWVHLNFKETKYFYTLKAIKEDGESSVVKFAKVNTKKGFLGLFINRLYPYFGGKIASPYSMSIELKYFKKFI
jgi:hypothetical protein